MLGSVLLLTGCGQPSVTSLQEGTKEAVQGVKENVDLFTQNMKEAFTYHVPDKTPKPIPPSYCYHVLQDIMCYHRPIAGAEGRLVGYQGTVEEPEAAKQAAAAVAAPDTPHQAEAAPVAPVDATSSDKPGSPAAMMQAAVAATSSPQAPTPLTMTDDEKSKAEKSMEHFDSMQPVAVGAGPAVKADSGPTP